MKMILAILSFTVISSAAFADDTGSIMTVGPWTVYTYTPGGNSTDGADGTSWTNTYSDTALLGTRATDKKVILDAIEDASYFVASGGGAKTAALGQAIDVVKAVVQGASEASDMEVALFITAVQL